MKNSPSELVLCASYYDTTTASIAIDVLSSHGIQAIDDNAMMSTILPPAGSVRLMVRRNDLEEARRILSDGGLLDN